MPSRRAGRASHSRRTARSSSPRRCGTPLGTTFVNSSQLTAIVPPLNIATVGTASITVTNLAPGGGVSNVIYFEVNNPISTLAFSTFYSYSPGQVQVEEGNDMAVADFNGDGKLDLALLSDVLSAIVIQLGNGDGTYQQPSVHTGTGTEPRGLVAADFNGDGKLDIAVGSLSDNTGSIFLGNGDGTFQAAKKFATGQAGTFLVSAGDFNHDGKLDLALAIQDSGVSILLGNGDGSFQTPTIYIPQFRGSAPLSEWPWVTLTETVSSILRTFATTPVTNPSFSSCSVTGTAHFNSRAARHFRLHFLSTHWRRILMETVNLIWLPLVGLALVAS